MSTEKRRRETSKVLLGTIVAASVIISMASMVLCAWLAVDQLGIAITVIGGIWSGAVIAAIGFYSDKAKAENEIKLQAMLQAPPEELTQAQAERDAALAGEKKMKAERDKARKEVERPGHGRRDRRPSSRSDPPGRQWGYRPRQSCARPASRSGFFRRHRSAEE